MKQFSCELMQIKTGTTEKGESIFEPIMAIKGESVYEMARRTGYIGSEDEFLEAIIGGGWVQECVKLENEKANKADVYTKNEVNTLLSDNYEVGDVKITARAMNNSKWKLCDGAIIDIADYPSLKNSPSILHKCVEYGGRKIVYGNGYWVIAPVTNKNENIIIYYTNDSINGEWADKTVYTHSGEGNETVRLNDIAYCDGYWVVTYTIEDRDFDTCKTISAYTTDLVAGNWSTTIVATHEYTSSVDVNNTGVTTTAYGDKVLVAIGEYSGITPIVFTAHNPEMTWSQDSTFSGAGTLTDVAYGDGTWVVVGYSDAGVNIYATNRIHGSWKEKTLDSMSKLYSVTYYNGTWVAVGETTTDENGNVYIGTYTTTDPINGEWTFIKINSISIKPGYVGVEYNKSDNWWYIMCCKKDAAGNSITLLQTATPDGGGLGDTWVILDKTFDGSIGTVSATYFAIYDGVYTVTNGGHSWFSSRRALPNIQHDGARAYIKVTE